MKGWSISLLLTLFVLNLGGCGTSEEDSPDPASSDDDSEFVEYGVAGHIIEKTPMENEDFVGTIQVEGPEENGAEYKEAIVRIKPDTKIYENELTDFESLEVGKYVNVFFDGPVQESYPVQATAKQVNIIPEE